MGRDPSTCICMRSGDKRHDPLMVESSISETSQYLTLYVAMD